MYAEDGSNDPTFLKKVKNHYGKMKGLTLAMYEKEIIF
jgi:hypothetical protein